MKSSSQGERVQTLLMRNGRSSTLFFRLVLLNLLAFALLFAAWWEGFVATVVTADQTHLSVLIFFVFVVGLIISFWRALQINREIDQFCAVDKQAATVGVSNGDNGDGAAPMAPPGSMGALRLRLTHRIASVRHIANVLVLLGLIGTVLGFIIALSGVNPESAGDIEGIAPMVSTLIQGMSTALYTTLIGSILNVWLSANYQILASGTVELMSRWIDAAERKEESSTGASNA
ncbi:MAG: MotA/TolQ/ExbB proton channel family protein [Granulosicoccus sp.]